MDHGNPRRFCHIENNILGPNLPIGPALTPETLFPDPGFSASRSFELSAPRFHMKGG